MPYDWHRYRWQLSFAPDKRDRQLAAPHAADSYPRPRPMTSMGRSNDPSPGARIRRYPTKVETPHPTTATPAVINEPSLGCDVPPRALSLSPKSGLRRREWKLGRQLRRLGVQGYCVPRVEGVVRFVYYGRRCLPVVGCTLAMYDDAQQSGAAAFQRFQRSM